MLDSLSKKRLINMGVSLFIAYLAVAMALPVVSVYVCHNLGYSNWLGGLAVGISFLSTIFSRKYAGTFSDLKSPKKCTMLGVFLYMLAAAVCLLSTMTILPVRLSYAILIIGRLILGFGESMTMVGLTGWHFSLVGPQHSGKILSIVGMAMYGAFVVGGPLGLGIYEKYGFGILMCISFLLPLIGGLLLIKTPNIQPKTATKNKKSFISILNKIWKQGMVVGLQGVGFAVLGAFILLYFKDKGWSYSGYGLSLFGTGFVLSRIMFGNIPDRFGGVWLSFISLAVELSGQVLLWLSPNAFIALTGALLTGLGCSMIFPAMGVEVIKRVPGEYRATAFGGFAAFQDLSYAFSAPLAGALVDFFDYSIVFLLGAVSAAIGIIFVILTERENNQLLSGNESQNF